MVRDPSLGSNERTWLMVLATLNEQQARIYVAQRALELGRGGVLRLSNLTGMSRPTIMKGAGEIRAGLPLKASFRERIRRAGAGRKRVEEVQPEVLRELKAILEETTGGDPMTSLRWTCKSTAIMESELRRKGYRIGSRSVARCLHDLGYSLQGNVKTVEGKPHSDRDAQFRYISARVTSFMKSGDPVISVDTKKKELVGRFKNAGRTWRRQGDPERVNSKDFPDLAEGKAIPYGAYDIGRNTALVNVGVSHDTGEFAVEGIRRWWRMLGRRAYPDAAGLLICADAGGSNGHRLRLWKVHLQNLATELQIPVTVCHYPPGTSKWNKIEHRLFSFISLNWRGRPLLNYETVVNLIGATRTRTGLKVKAVLDTKEYATGKKVPNDEFKQLRLDRHSFHGDWNYTLRPS